jgi:hypothetical protein
VGLTIKTMALLFIGMFVLTAGIAWAWATAIEDWDKYQKQNPNHDPNQGWLDWDCDKAHTEHEL